MAKSMCLRSEGEERVAKCMCLRSEGEERVAKCMCLRSEGEWPSVCVYVQKVKGDKSYTIIKGATTDVTSRDGNVRDDCITSDSRIWKTGSQLVSIESCRPLYVYKV